MLGPYLSRWRTARWRAAWRARGRRRPEWVSLLLMAIGLALLLYVGTEYARSWAQQRSLARQWAAQQQRAQDAAGGEAALTRLTIPRIGFNAIVVEGTTALDLLLGPGHIPETVEPGQAGNAVITGHRDTFFRHLHELQRGDLVSVVRSGRSYEYEVTGKKIVNPEDLSVIRPSTETRLTLITCYPTYYVGPAPNRLVVFTRLLHGEETAAKVPRVKSVSR